MFTDFFFFCQIFFYVLSAPAVNYYSQHHHQVFLLLLLLVLFSTLTFCCFSLICTDCIEVMRLLPVKPSGINFSALPRPLTGIFTPSPQTGIVVPLSVVITSETSSLKSAVDTKDRNLACCLGWITQFTSPSIIVFHYTKKGFLALVPGPLKAELALFPEQLSVQ